MYLSYRQVDLLPEPTGSNDAGLGAAPSAPLAKGKEEEKKAAAGGGGGLAADATAAEAALQERRRRCLEWCLDNGFEYVEADCRDPCTGRFARLVGTR